MTDLRVTIPHDKGKLPPINHTIFQLIAYGNGSKKYSTDDRSKYLHIHPTTGDVSFTEKGFNKMKNGSGEIAASITVKDGIRLRDHTSLIVNMSEQSPLNCDEIVQDLCFWQSASYRIQENNHPPTRIGPLAPAYLAELCPGYKINYVLPKNDDFKVASSGNSWILEASRTLDKDVAFANKILAVTCTVENPQQNVREIKRNIPIEILDIDDNRPRPQDSPIHVHLTSNVVTKGRELEHKDLILQDLDSEAVNTYEMTILEDPLHLLEPKCKTFFADHQEGLNQTVIHCRLYFKKTMAVPNETYSVVFQVTDTTLVKGNKKVKVPIHLHFNSSGSPGYLRGTYDNKLNLYLSGTYKIFRTAAPLARIAQPEPALFKDAKNFTVSAPLEAGDIFNVTYDGGILHVKNSEELENAREFLSLNISWYRGNKMEFDEIGVRIVNEPTKTCLNYTLHDWTSCSFFKEPKECLRSNTCAISTGGSASVATRGNPERCMWRGDKRPGITVTHLYSTCTPDIATCPDGICDALEKLNHLICPQDCVGLGVDSGSGVCYCDQVGGCQCGHMVEDKEETKGNIPISKTDNTLKMNSIRPNTTSSRVGNSTTAKFFGAGLVHCGTTCVLGIVAGGTLLVAVAVLMVICWRLDSVHRAVRRKFTTDPPDLSARYSEYINRNMPDALPLNFDMTTSLADTAALNIIHKFEPDPKWEFPRNQLVIEQTLGEGEFGRVLRARALNIAGQSGQITVAVKTLKDDARETELNDLLSEYQLLKEVSHPNVIRLLGVCTFPGGPVYLIIEFAEFGSLRNYLRRSRHLKAECGRLPLSSGLDDTDLQYDEPNVSKITSKEILSFAWQICKGMTHLSDIKLVHRDLAARNVLLATDKVCKISDFGLTRDIYEDDAYFKRSKGRVPVKWMAPESLSDHVYTNKSDVWSFGILVWELVTLGAAPYPGIAVQNLFHLLRQGYRMERPDNCSQALYDVMRSCWHIEPEHRPTFHELSALWEKMLTDQVEYLDLTNNSIHNRSYFCSNIDDQSEMSDKSETSPLNYLSKTQSYVKCGSAQKLPDNANLLNEPDKNQNDIGTQGYETPVKLPKRPSTPTNENPQYYTDMTAGGKID